MPELGSSRSNASASPISAIARHSLRLLPPLYVRAARSAISWPANGSMCEHVGHTRQTCTVYLKLVVGKRETRTA